MYNLLEPDKLKDFFNILTLLFAYLLIIFLYSSVGIGFFSIGQVNGVNLNDLGLFAYILLALPLCSFLFYTLFNNDYLNKLSNYFWPLLYISFFDFFVLACYYALKLNKLTTNETYYIEYLGIFSSVIFALLFIFIMSNLYVIDTLRSITDIFLYIKNYFYELLTTLFTDENFRNSYISTFLKFALLFLGIFLFFYYTNYKNANSITFYLSIAAIVGAFLYFFISKEILNYIFIEHKWKVVILFIVITLIASGYEYFTKYISANTKYTIEYISILFGILIGIVALAILFILLKKWFSETSGIVGLIINLIFYIPCLFIDFINYIKNEIKMTSNIMYILFIIEIILILLYIYIPIIKSQIENNSATTLLPDAIFLNSVKQVGNNDMYKMYNYNYNSLDNDLSKSSSYRTNYGISFWIYINPQQGNHTTSRETPIFDFNKKPRFSYTSNTTETDALYDTFAIDYTNKNNAKPIHIKLEKQKWHYIFFNYFTDHVELFIDGKLDKTYFFKDSLPSYSPDDVVTLGYENGLYGAICNVKYYSKNIIPENISRIYNLLMFSNPPTD